MLQKIREFLGPMIVGMLLVLLGFFAYDYINIRTAAIQGAAAFEYINRVVQEQQKQAKAAQQPQPVK